MKAISLFSGAGGFEQGFDRAGIETQLMGWTDGWTEWGLGADGERINMADTHRFRLIGNGVASPVAQWLGHRLVEVDSWA